MNEDKLKKVINQLEEEVVKDYLYKITVANSKLYDKFKLQFLNLFDNKNIHEYVDEIKKVKKEIEDNYDIEEDEYMDPYEERIEHFELEELERIIKKMLDEAQRFHELNETVFSIQIISVILKNLPILEDLEEEMEYANSYIETIDYVLYMMLENLCKYLASNIEIDDNLIEEIFKSIENIMNEIDYTQRTILNMCENLIQKNMYLNKIKEILLRNIDSKLSSYSNQIAKTNLIINILEIQGNEEELIKYMKKFTNNYDILVKYIELLMDKNQNKEVVKILEDIVISKKKMDIYKRDNKKEIIYKLSDMYLEINEISKYRNVLLKLITEYEAYNIESYIKIKETYTKEEWKKEMINIRNKIKDEILILDILLEEKELQTLMNQIYEKKNIYYLKKYEIYLVDEFNDSIYEMYKDHVLKEIKAASKRSIYAQIGKQLKHMLSIKNHKDIAQEFIEDIVNEYGARHAMLDEFRMCGLKF